jgi:hypothetical protein
MTPQRITDATTRVKDLMQARLGLSAATLDDQLCKAGRSLPRRVRRAGAYLVQAEAMSGQPRLFRQIDAARLDRAERICRTYLQGIDPAERKKDKVLRLLAVVAFNFLLLAALVIAVLAWRGIIGPE